MSFDYASKQATATRLIAKFGQVGSITYRPMTGPDWDPIVLDPVTVEITFVDLDIIKSAEDPTLHAQAKRTLLIAVPDGFIPTKAQIVMIAGKPSTIDDVRPFAPAGLAVFYEADLIS